jgi:hypothetical protein
VGLTGLGEAFGATDSATSTSSEPTGSPSAAPRSRHDCAGPAFGAPARLAVDLDSASPPGFASSGHASESASIAAAGATSCSSNAEARDN